VSHERERERERQEERERERERDKFAEIEMNCARTWTKRDSIDVTWKGIRVFRIN